MGNLAHWSKTYSVKENVLNEEGNILFNDMQHPTDRIIHTTAFVTPVVEHWLEQEIAQWVHPLKDQSDDPVQYIYVLNYFDK